MPAASLETDLTPAYRTIADFIDTTAGDFIVPDMPTYQELLHASGAVDAAVTLIREHPAVTVLDEAQGNSSLHIDAGKAEVHAQVVGPQGSELVRIATYHLPPGVGPKERYSFVGRQKSFGDLAVRSWLRQEEIYYAYKRSGQPASSEELTKLIRLTRTTFERFIDLAGTQL